MDRPAWRLDDATRTAERLTDCPLSLNGIAKGYIVERACELAMDRNRGVPRRDAQRGRRPSRPRRDRRHDRDRRTMGRFGVVRADGLYRGQGPIGRHQREFPARVPDRWPMVLAHLRSTIGPPRRANVAATVVAERAVNADAFAKVCNVLEPGQSILMARSLPGVECLIVAKDGQTFRSDGWHRYERPLPGLLAQADEPKSSKAKATKAAAGPAWNKDYELVVNFEINRPDAETGRYRRPYVAIWAEDKDGTSVRTMSLWVSMGGAGRSSGSRT